MTASWMESTMEVEPLAGALPFSHLEDPLLEIWGANQLEDAKFVAGTPNRMEAVWRLSPKINAAALRCSPWLGKLGCAASSGRRFPLGCCCCFHRSEHQQQHAQSRPTRAR